MIWHNTEAEKVLKELSVDPAKGLYSGVADDRISIYGKNTVTNEEQSSFLKHFISAFNNKFNYILIILSVISFILCFVYDRANFLSPVLIIAILISDSLISAYYMHKSAQAVNRLSGNINPSVTVLRDGLQKQISSDYIVPGDILLLKEGDYITADARLIECANFRTNEFAVTGEKFEIEKHANEVFDDITPIKQRLNMIYSGSSVASGTAKAVVVETARNTEIGKNVEILEQTGSDNLPVNESLRKIEKIVTIAVLTVCAVYFLLEILFGRRGTVPFAELTVELLSNSFALAISAIPESLPAISVIVVALGINRILESKIAVKKIKVLELLGKTNVILSDKTGILTKRVMNLTTVYDGETTSVLSNDGINEKNALILRLATVCSTLDNDSTEQAIERACKEYCNIGKSDIENIFPRLSVIPFDTARKTMTTINMINNAPMAIVKGAPESLISKCVNCDNEKIEKKYEEMSQNGQRVLCIAIKNLTEIPANPLPEEIENGLTFVALLGLDDPPRSGAVNGIRICTEAGIKTIMITGDSLSTAIAIAKQIGVLTDDSQAISGDELNALSDAELKSQIERYTVYARITPADKQRIITAWQEKGKLVTVTGDNTEDADALKRADVGCVMGTGGTDVARGTADLVIEENNFKFLVKAIQESRGLFENIKKCTCYLFSCNLSELLIELICLLIFKVPALIAVQLLLINFLTDCAPAISLALEKPERAVLKKKPITLNGKIFDFNSVASIISGGIFMTVTGVLSFAIGNSQSTAVASTMLFATVSISQILHSYNLKCEKSIIRTELRENRFMNYSTVVALFVSMFIVLTPAAFALELTILSAEKFFISLGLAVLIIPFGELQKLFLKKYGVK